MILVDYPRQARLKILGRAEIIDGEGARAWVERLRNADYKATVERVFVIRVEAFDWNCRQHITPRFTADQIREVLEPMTKKMRQLELDNERLQGELARISARASAGPFSHAD